MPRFGVSGGPRLGRQIAAGAGTAGPERNLNYRQRMGSGGSFTYRWNGGTVMQMVNSAMAQGFSRIEREAEEEWVQIVHVISGHLRDSMHIFTDIGRNGKLTLLAINDAEYADFEERGTIYREGHFPMRQTFDRVVPRIPAIMLDAFRQTGFR